MTLYTLAFYFFSAVCVGAGLAILFSGNVFKSALYLLLVLMSLAALYILTFAEFLAVSQILIYAGGILVVILFGIMLTTKSTGKSLQVKHGNIAGGILAAVVLLALLGHLISSWSLPGEYETSSLIGTIPAFGTALMSSHVLPFEVSGILLLMALTGAAVITSSVPTKEK